MSHQCTGLLLFYRSALTVTFTNVGHLVETVFCVDAVLKIGDDVVATKKYSYTVIANTLGTVEVEQSINGEVISSTNGGTESGTQVSRHLFWMLLLQIGSDLLYRFVLKS